MSLDIADNIRQYGFKRLLLAVSGGLDSICLAHYFICNKAALGIEWLGIAHVHHGLREETADRDAAFVEAFTKSLGVPFFLKKLDGMALKSAEGSLEENAREARYSALFEIAEKNFGTGSFPYRLGSGVRMTKANEAPGSTTDKYAIVTAHHAGDQVETVYMRIRRGTTLAGLRGMQALRQAQGPCRLKDFSSLVHNDTSGILLYRPFLNVTRSDLLAYARENNLTWCEDESNADTQYARNKIRHQLLPHLENECPGATKQLCRIAELADRAYGKVVDAGESLFAPVLRDGDADADIHQHDLRVGITLDKRRLRSVLREHVSTDLSEVFRLWLAAQGLRFPIGFFYDSREPAHVKIPHRAVYRKRAICKIGHTVQIREFCTPEEAQKFVSCGSRKMHVEKDKNEPS